MLLKKLLTVVILGAPLLPLQAQQDFTMFNLRNVQQARYTNAAIAPNRKVNVGFPALSSTYLSLSNSGFAWKDLFVQTASDSLSLNMDNALSKMNDVNYLQMELNLDLLHFGFRAGKGYFSLNVTEKMGARFSYPKGLLQLIWEGNGKTGSIGERVSFDGIGFDAIHYREHGLGYSRDVNDKLSIGGKVKYLQGISNLYSKKSVFGLTTDSVSYAITMDGQYEIYTAGMATSLFDSSSSFSASDVLYGSSNRGFGLDLGVLYNLHERVEVGLGINDLGAIKWSDDSRKYAAAGGTFTFDGLDLLGGADLTSPDSINSGEEGGINIPMLDSIIDAFTPIETRESYTTALGPKIYLSARYFLTKKASVGGLFYAQIYKGKMRTALSGSMNVSVKKFLDASVTYSIYNRSYANLGVGLSLNLGAIQLYFATDNLLAMAAPHAVRNAHFRGGINFIFGHVDKDRAKLGPAKSRPVMN